MKFALCIFLSLTFLTGCDPITERVFVSYIGTKTASKSCDLGLGYCMGCGLNLSGSYDCSLKMKFNCTGNQQALYNVNRYKITRESGKIEYRDSKVFKRNLSECK